MGEKICITRVKLFNAELFRRRFRARMIWALMLTLLFACSMIYIVARFLEGTL